MTNVFTKEGDFSYSSRVERPRRSERANGESCQRKVNDLFTNHAKCKHNNKKNVDFVLIWRTEMKSEAQNSMSACHVYLFHKVFYCTSIRHLQERLRALAEEKVTVMMYERMNGTGMFRVAVTERQSQRWKHSWGGKHRQKLLRLAADYPFFKYGCVISRAPHIRELRIERH